MRLSSHGLVVDKKIISIHGELKHLEIAKKHFGSAKLDEKHKRLNVYLSKTNLIKIGQIFNPRPVLIKGQEFVEALKDKVSRWNEQGNIIRKVLAKPGTMRAEEVPLILPHSYEFKVAPRDHQHKTFMLLDKCPNLNVMLDCFLPGTLVKSGSKYVKIEDIKIGSSIETLAGLSEVENTISKNYSGDIFEVSTSSGFFPLKVTPNHKFYVCRYDKRKIELMDADNLNVGDYLLYKRREAKESKGPIIFTTKKETDALEARDLLLDCGFEFDSIVDGCLYKITNLTDAKIGRIGSNYYTFIPIREIKKSKYSGKVYNLTSAGHDSYLTEAGTSKNCGTGKTFILLTSTEYKIQKEKIARGKTLVSGPLSVISSAWIDDSIKFTNMKVGILWTDKGTKEILGEKFLVKDFGPKPVYCIGKRVKKLKQWRSRDNHGIVKAELDPFDKEMVCHWNESKNPDKDEWIAHGKMYARTRTTVSGKRLHIEAMLADPSYDLFAINHDGVRLHWDLLVKHGFDQIIIDESTKIKNPQSKVFKAHLKISENSNYRYVMSGTPAPNGAYDLWSQFFFSDRGMTLEPSLKDFRDLFFDEIVVANVASGNSDETKDVKKYVPKSDESIHEIAKRLMAGSVRYRQDECLDLPKRQNLPVPILMSVAQTLAYIKMEKDLIADFTDKEGNRKVIEASVALVKLLRLRQITSGFAKASDKAEDADDFHLAMSVDDQSPQKITEFAENPKMDALESLLDQIGENKMIVITNYQYEIDMICKRFAEFSPMFIDGRTKGRDRPEIITRFQNDPKFRLIVLHPAAAGHGITLTSARYMTFFSMTNNYEHEYQSAKRIERYGQQHEMTMYYMQGRLNPKALDLDEDKTYDRSALETVDHTLYKLVRDKEAVQTQLIDKQPVKDFDWATAATNEIFEQIAKRQEYVERIISRPEGFNLEESIQSENGLL
jgi:hypothetical protein